MNSVLIMDRTIFYLLIGYALLSSISIAGTSIVLGLAVVVTIVRCVKEPIKFELDVGMTKALIFFFIALLVSSLTAYEPLTSFNQVWKYFYRMAPFFLALLFIKDRQQLLAIMVSLSVSICIADGYAIWQGIFEQRRAVGFGANAMILAGYLVQMIPLLLVMATGSINSGKKRLFFMSVFLLSLVALIYNGTRGAWLAIAGSLLIYGIINLKKNKYILPGLLVLFLVIGLIFGTTPAVTKRIQSITDTNFQSNTERVLLWKSSWHMFRDNPITGVGPGNFEKLYLPKYILPEAKEPELSHAHNNFIHMAAETGILGLAGFLYLFGYILYSTWRHYRQYPTDVWAVGCFLVTVCLLLQGLTEFNFGNSAVMRLYWFIVGLMFVSNKLYHQEIGNETRNDL